jgi:hypothetical protein
MGSGSDLITSDADDLTDLTIAPKLRLWQGLEDKLKFGTRMDLKLPIASDRHGLGTGNSDIGVVGIATYTIGRRAWTLMPDLSAEHAGRWLCHLVF